MRGRSVFLVTAAALLCAGCNQTTAPAPVGNIEHVISPQASVDGTATSDGADLFRANTVSTDSDGAVTFHLVSGNLLCEMLSLAEVQVQPDGETLVQWQSGETICAKQGGAATGSHTVTSAGTSIEWDDPVFAVIVQESGDVVKVSQGFVRVQSEATGGSVLVGPGQQTIVNRGMDPIPSIPIELTVLEQGIFQEMDQWYEPPELGRPLQIEESGTLIRVFERESILVALDVSQETSDEDVAFVRDILDLLGQSWGVQSEIVMVGMTDLLRQPDLSEVDVVVSRRPPEEMSTIPFFQREGEELWVLAFREDSAFGGAMEDFLVGALMQGRYDEAYLRAFGTTPSYQEFEPLLFRP